MTLSVFSFELFTEDYPPFNMAGENHVITGMSSEIVLEMFKRSKIPVSVNLYPWKRSFRKALKTKNSGVFSTTLTQKRKDKFKWIGPIVTNKWVFLARKESKIKISKVEDIKKYSVGAYSGDAFANFLNEFKGIDLQLTTLDRMNARKLAADRIQLWATGSLLGQYLSKQENVEDLEVVYTFKSVNLYLAVNKKTDDVTVSKLQKSLNEMVKDGTLKRIKEKY